MRSLRSLLVVTLLTVPIAAQPRQETLTLDRAIEIALQQQPSVRAQQADIEAPAAASTRRRSPSARPCR